MAELEVRWSEFWEAVYQSLEFRKHQEFSHNADKF